MTLTATDDLQRRLQEALSAAQAGGNPLEILEAALRKLDQGREALALRINTRLELRGADGEIKDVRELHNVICTAGKNLLLASGGTAKYVKDYAYVCIGTNATSEAAGNTALGAEVARALGTVSNPASNTLRVTYTFPAGTGTGAITESALDHSSSATAAILARQTFSVINKGASDTLQVTWDIT